MGQTVLANQFIAGLCPELKAEVVGTDGNLEQLLVKVRFEEAKKRELATSKATPPPKKPSAIRIKVNFNYLWYSENGLEIESLF